MHPTKVMITETVLRDAHQSLIATRMRTEDMIPIAQKLDEVGYWSVEVWGGATFDSCIRFLREDPWERLRVLKTAFKKTKLQMLLRGQSILGYKHYADDVLVKFIEKSVENGIDVVRIFDALNDLRNLDIAIRTTRRFGAIAEGAISYTTSPVHTVDLYVDMAMRLEDMGSDLICIKDMAGLLTPQAAAILVGRIVERVKAPVHIHSHETSGMASMAMMEAVRAGARHLDTAIGAFASGTSHPATESIVGSLAGTPYDTGLDLVNLSEIDDYFRVVRRKYKKFESEFTRIDTKVLISQIPGGMISNLAAQLKDQNALDRMQEILAETPRVRKDFGYPPLVTPTSQIVGTQATLNVLTGTRYKVITTETKNYLKGLYGRPPAPIDPEVRKRAIGDEEPIDLRPADLLDPEMEKLTREISEKAKSIEDVLTYAMFPSLALEFFELREKGDLIPESLEEEKATEVAVDTESRHYAPSEFNITVHGETYKIKVSGVGHKDDQNVRPYFIKVDDRLEEVLVESLVEVVPSYAGEITAAIASKASSKPKASKLGDITTPMPGRIARILVEIGQRVSEGDTVLVVEAMKMENEVHAPLSGTVKEIYVSESDMVNPDETLIVVE